ncbi:MAG: alpha/beta fold hydrolase [Hyphomicrobiaceae bacterium]|nr:alpha/beta fold hydrolase [Hyphomicrobiaceae bacterium]
MADPKGASTERLDFARDGSNWPHREASRFIESSGLNWHLQIMRPPGVGFAPPILLVHGTGASTHSWRDVMPIVARRMTVIAVDLPGHGFTSMPTDGAGLSLPGMARGITGLLSTLGLAPRIAAGHSAGAAILTRMALDGKLPLDTMISLNGAILPLGGLAGTIFSPIAKFLVGLDFVPRYAASRNADPSVLKGYLANTGSTLTQEGLDLYGTLARSPGHVAAALAMMANWNLDAMEPDLPKLDARVVLVAAALDRMIKPDDSFRLRDRLRNAEVVFLRDVGHLAHEERPAEIAELILARAVQAGILPPPEPDSTGVGSRSVPNPPSGPADRRSPQGMP